MSGPERSAKWFPMKRLAYQETVTLSGEQIHTHATVIDFRDLGGKNRGHREHQWMGSLAQCGWPGPGTREIGRARRRRTEVARLDFVQP
jgi:hypothetical protein